MNLTIRLTRALAGAALFATISLGSVPASNAGSPPTAARTQSRIDRQIARGTRQCLREAQRDFDRCRRRAHGNRAWLARCRREYRRRISACSG